jgi:hypothetical protein
MEECRKRKLNKEKLGIFWQPTPEYADYHPEYSDTPIRTIRILIQSIRTPHPDYPDLCPEYPITLVMFRTVPTPNAEILNQRMT